MTVPSDGWTLAIDFGTSNTVAVVKDAQGARAVQFADGNPYFPSVVFAADDGSLISGLSAFNNRLIHPRRYFAGVKRAVTEGDSTIQLAQHQYSSAEVVAAVLKEAKTSAMRSRADPDQPPARTALTHPVDWDDDQIDVLRRAAKIAELPLPTTFEEPVAAAYQLYFTQYQPGAHIAVYDLGGGTFDAALLQRIDMTQTTPGLAPAAPYRVVGTNGDSGIGGELFDDRIHEMIGGTDLREAPPWQALQPGNAPDRSNEAYADWLVDRRTLRQSIIDAKIDLSSRSMAAVYIPGVKIPHTITRSALENELGANLSTTVDLLVELIHDHELSTDDIAHVALVGGSSKIPMVRSLLVERARFDDSRISAPAVAQTIVALGAAALADVKPVETEAEKAFMAGEAWAAAHGWRQAGAAYQSAIDLADNQWSPRAAHQLGRLRAENPERTLFKKNYEPAIAAFRIAAKYHGSEWAARAMSSLAELLLQLNRIDEAIVFFDNAVRASHPDIAPEAAFQLGLLHIRRNDWRSAEDSWQTAIDHAHPDWSPRAAFELGANRRMRKNHSGARDAWRVAATAFNHPEWSPKAACELGQLLRDKGRRAWQLSEADFQAEIEAMYRCAFDSRHPELSPRAAFELGMVRQKRRQWQGAADAYQDAISSGHPVWGPRAVERRSNILRHL